MLYIKKTLYIKIREKRGRLNIKYLVIIIGDWMKGNPTFVVILANVGFFILYKYRRKK
jgi:hypothetical protein